MSRTNDQVIKDALARFTAQKDAYIGEKLCELMQLGLEAVLEAHDAPIVGGNIFHHNLSEKDTLGWAVYHDGSKIGSGTQDRGSVKGSVQEMMDGLFGGTKGWIGVIMSEMTFDWYRVDYEVAFLNYSADQIKQNFHNIFKPIRVGTSTMSFS